jgi:ribosomal protein S18 acetylase RimI-like enzyme
MKAITTASAFRFLTSLRRPLKTGTGSLVAQPEEFHEPLIFRETIYPDLRALTALHVKTWNDTFPGAKQPPTYELLEAQWRQTFEAYDDSWFCFVIENFKGELIGFAKGMKYHNDKLSGFSGELSSICLLREYQRLGLGRRLMGCVSRRFLTHSITSMVTFSADGNAASHFYEALEGQKLGGAESSTYGWHDLQHLASICPIGKNLSALVVDPKL